MAKISLRAYNREIEDLIEQGQRLDEAVAHCLHILRSFPKHLETYRLLGKAYLEAKRYEQAVDIFQRVLVAAPEGIRALGAAHPDVRCWTAAVDSHLNELGYIIPGLGDAGDKIFGTK